MYMHTQVGARLDRNGLRPARFWQTKDDLIYVASEVRACLCVRAIERGFSSLCVCVCVCVCQVDVLIGALKQYRVQQYRVKQYRVTSKTSFFLCACACFPLQVGVLNDVLSNAENVVAKGRLGPGQMVVADLEVCVIFKVYVCGGGGGP